MTPISAHEHAAPLGKWNSHVRRARIGRERKHAALTFSSYADDDGTGIRCGIARLAVDCEIGYSTARRYVAWMREVGLIALSKPGNHKAHRADEYRLVLDPQVYQRLEIPEDDEYRKLVDEVNGSNRSAQKARRTAHQRSLKASANTTDPAESSALTVLSADAGYQRSFSGLSALTLDEPPPSSTTFQVRAPSTGGAPPPDPRRPQAPTASGPGTDERESPNGPLTQAQDQQGESLPHANARGPRDPEHLASVTHIHTREAS